MSAPTIHAVLLNWRTAPMTLDALEALVLSLEATACPWTVSVVDNDSQDGSEEALRQAVAERGDDRIEVLQSGHNGGFGAGNNVGLRRGLERGADFLYILNSDAFPQERALRFLVDHLQAHPRVGIVGSSIYGTDGEPHCTAFRFPSIQSELEGALRLGVVSKALEDYVVPMGIPERTQKVDWLAGASMMFRREVLEKVGLFDESFFLYFEETDLCHRAAEAGFETVYVWESEVAHVGSASTGMKTWSRVPDYWFDSRSHYFAKNHGRAYLAAATSARLVGTAVWQLRRRLQSKPEEDPPRFLAGLLGHSLRRAARGVLPR
ncbi:MAG: glycosyl transferase [Sandaracinus sp.]|nr:glycosyl transferase [Sandaracinus sp.]